MQKRTGFTYYKDCAYPTTPLIVLPAGTVPEGFIAGYRIEVQQADESWLTIGYQGENAPHNVHVRASTGELVRYLEPLPEVDDENVPASIGKRESDAFVELMPLGEGWYRVAGLELNRRELLGLLPRLEPDWRGVLYPTDDKQVFALWEVGGGYGNWCTYHLERVELAEAEGLRPHYRLSESGPHTLYRIHYEDPMRPGLLPGLCREQGYCLGFNRPNGPEMLYMVEAQLLGEYWPIENVHEVLSTEEIQAAHLLPLPATTQAASLTR